MSFVDTLTVIASKQRPKRLAMMGTDGKEHRFLLKGHEDLRLDERVMQLFRLVNTLILANAQTSKVSGYQIQRYSVTPLWDSVGLIGWVDECDTIHQLISNYRTQRNIPAELELRMLHQIIAAEQPKAFDILTTMHKMEVVEYLADQTSGMDVQQAMWSTSLNCETWLERRQTFTVSLATMSVVGYMLGLGDRHPNNIMVQRSTGKVVHIDFGDCFEVAMSREKFPEKVPFRLTRMLRRALEVCGVDGKYRSSAETVMSLLRENHESVLAMLGAFVQDPLISWRLVQRPGNNSKGEEPSRNVMESPRGGGERAAGQLSTRGALPAQDDSSSPLMQLMPQTSSSESDEEIVRRCWRAHARLASARDLHSGGSGAGGTNNAAQDTAEEIHQGVLIMRRLASKLRGQEFPNAASTTFEQVQLHHHGNLKTSLEKGGVHKRNKHSTLAPKDQVTRLINEAIDMNNVAQSWSGWYPFW